jgi:hypothetical protein
VRRFLASALTIFLIVALAMGTPRLAAQASSIIQSGPWTVGHLGCYVGQGSAQAVMTDCGPAGGVGTGSGSQGVSEFLEVATGPPGQAPYSGLGTGPYGTIHCLYDAPIDNPSGYHALCLSPNAQGGGLLTYNAYGSASALPFNCIVNGTLLSPCFGGGGGSPNTIRVILTGSADAASTTDITIAWNSSSASAKSQVVPACTSLNAAKIYTIKDEYGNAQQYPITIAPPSGTIDGLNTYVIQTNLAAVTMQCDGISNYVVL